MSYFRVFGCDAYVHVPKNQREKLDERSKGHIFVGYNLISMGYRLYDLDLDDIIVNCDVIFDEISNLERALEKEYASSKG